jgi:beta-glucosidase
MHLATTFNEANIQLLVNLSPNSRPGFPQRAKRSPRRRAPPVRPRFSRLAYADPAIVTP